MKTELKIAEENMKLRKGCVTPRDTDYVFGKIESHKESCKRFLEFLEKEKKFFDKLYYPQYIVQETPYLVTNEQFFVDESVEEDTFKQIEIVVDKITDLKNAIKLYEEKGL